MRGAEAEAKLHYAAEGDQDTERQLNPARTVRSGPRLRPRDLRLGHAGHQRAEGGEDEPAPQVAPRGVRITGVLPSHRHVAA